MRRRLARRDALVDPVRLVVLMLEHLLSDRPLTGVVDRILPTVSDGPHEAISWTSSGRIGLAV